MHKKYGSLAAISLLVTTITWPGWCQSRVPADGLLKPNYVTALLNGSRWQGKAFATRESKWLGKQEHQTSNWFDASFLTYSSYTTKDTFTGSVKRQVPAQWLSISHIPIVVGTYNLSDSATHQHSQINVRYDLLEGGDAISDSYSLAQASKNWIRIRKYDQRRELITGAFNLNLINQSGKVIHFTKGFFEIRMVDELK